MNRLHVGAAAVLLSVGASTALACPNGGGGGSTGGGGSPVALARPSVRMYVPSVQQMQRAYYAQMAQSQAYQQAMMQAQQYAQAKTAQREAKKQQRLAVARARRAEIVSQWKSRSSKSSSPAIVPTDNVTVLATTRSTR